MRLILLHRWGQARGRTAHPGRAPRTAAVLPLLFVGSLLFVVEAPPTPAITLPCKVVEVVDGDTITVELTVQTRVRLRDCWAPEPNEPGGPAATQHLTQRAMNRDGVLHIPLGEARRFGDVMSFDRVLGHVYLDGQRLDDSDLDERWRRSVPCDLSPQYWLDVEGRFVRVDREPGPPEIVARGISTNGNKEFPWLHTGGFYQGISQKYMWPPDSKPRSIGRTRRTGLVAFGGGRYRTGFVSNNAGIPITVPDWKWPVDTTFFEVLYHPTFDEVFEVRVLIREEDEWGVDRFVRFPEWTDWVEYAGEDDPISRHCQTQPLVRMRVEDEHPIQAFVVEGTTDRLPDSPKARDSFREVTELKSTLGGYWRGDAVLPSATGDHSIVPREYDGWITGNDRTQCMKCHQHAGEHVDRFDLFREWYGCIRGNDHSFVTP